MVKPQDAEKLHNLESKLKHNLILSNLPKSELPPPYRHIYPSLQQKDLEDLFIASTIPSNPTAPPPPVLPQPNAQHRQPTPPPLQGHETPDRSPDSSADVSGSLPVQRDTGIDPEVEEEPDSEASPSGAAAPGLPVKITSPINMQLRHGKTTGTKVEQIHLPFMTVGEQLLKKPIEIEDINRIVKHCPKPTTAPQGTITYLKRACKGRNYTQEDLRLIIDQIVGTHSGWDWTKIPTINNIQAADPAAVPAIQYPTASTYNLNTSQGQDNMWREVTGHMMEIFKTRSSLSTAIACKQKPGETIAEFWKRFNDCWTQEAGLEKSSQASLLISTWINNTLPHLTTPVKQMIPSWPSATLDAFRKQLLDREAAGCFDIKKPTTTTITHHYQGKGGGRSRRGRGRPWNNRSGYVRNNNPGGEVPRTIPGNCYTCGETGHWARDCTRPRKSLNPPAKPMGSTSDAGHSGPRFPIDWTNQRPY